MGSRQSGVPRKKLPLKSNLNKVKAARNKNSPSSTNDSELSDADSGSADDDDELHTPKKRSRNVKTEDGDEDMVDADGDEDIYCTCQRISYGDMVACDNPGCKYEWFHWTCVGLKADPQGEWFCKDCTEARKK